MSAKATKTPPAEFHVVTGGNDVAYAIGGIPNSSARGVNNSAKAAPAKKQTDVDKAVQNKEANIAAKIALDVANQKQAAAVATGVVNANVASQAGVAARDAVLKANSSTKQTVALGVAAVVAVVAAGIYFLKRKTKHA